MKKPLGVILFLALFATLAFGATAYTRILNLRVTGLTLFGSADQKDVIAQSAFGTVDWAFPLDGGCTDTDPVALTGAKKGDPCFIGRGPSDGGVAIQVNTTAHLECLVTADDVAIVRLCNATTMGAIVDAGFSIRSFGVQ